MLTYATRWASCVYNCKPWPRRQACVHRHTPSTLKEEPSRPAFQDSHSLASSSHPSTHLTPAWPPSCFFLSLLRMLPLPPSQSNPIYPGRPSSNAINLTRSPQIFPAHFLPCSELKWQVAMDHTFVTHFELLSFNLSYDCRLFVNTWRVGPMPWFLYPILPSTVWQRQEILQDHWKDEILKFKLTQWYNRHKNNMYIPLYLIQQHVTHTKRKNTHVKGPVTKDGQENIYTIK